MIDLFMKFHEHVELAYQGNKLSKSCYENLRQRNAIDLFELDHDYSEFIYFMENAEYYITLDRITKGEELLEKETDSSKKSEYRKLLNDLTMKLDKLIPKGDSA